MSWHLGYLGIGQEASYGIAVAPTVFFPLVNAGVDRGHAPIQFNPRGLSGPSAVLGARTAQVQAMVETDLDGLGHVLTGLLGRPRTDLKAAGWYRHTFPVAAAGPSYSVEGYDGTCAVRASGVRFSSVGIAAEPGKRMGTTLTGPGRVAELVAPSVAAYSAADAPAWHAVTATLSGSGILTEVEALQVTVTVPVVPSGAQGTSRIAAASMLPGGRPVGLLGLTVADPSSAWLSYGTDATPLSVTVAAYGSYATGVASCMLQMDFPRVRVAATPFQLGRGNRAGVFQLAAFADAAAFGGQTIVLENITASY